MNNIIKQTKAPKQRFPGDRKFKDEDNPLNENKNKNKNSKEK